MEAECPQPAHLVASNTGASHFLVTSAQPLPADPGSMFVGMATTGLENAQDVQWPDPDALPYVPQQANMVPPPLEETFNPHDLNIRDEKWKCRAYRWQLAAGA